MFQVLLSLAIAPTLVGLFYIYIRDKYEKEPWRLLLLGVIVGGLISFPILRTAGLMAALTPPVGQMGEVAFTAFFVAGLVEEGFKFAALYFLIWHNRNLNEKMDGIVYAVFISLGFAGVENVLYVFHPEMGGLTTGIMRALISVPSHGFFGILMGYHFAMAKFEPQNRKKFILFAFLIPWVAHGIYNTLLLTDQSLLLLLFVPFVAAMWANGFKKIKQHLAASPFKS